MRRPASDEVSNLILLIAEKPRRGPGAASTVAEPAIRHGNRHAAGRRRVVRHLRRPLSRRVLVPKAGRSFFRRAGVPSFCRCDDCFFFVVFSKRYHNAFLSFP